MSPKSKWPQIYIAAKSALQMLLIFSKRWLTSFVQINVFLKKRPNPREPEANAFSHATREIHAAPVSRKRQGRAPLDSKHPSPGVGAAVPCRGCVRRAGPERGAAGAQLHRAVPSKILQLHLCCEPGWQTQRRVMLLMPEGGLGQSINTRELLGTTEMWLKLI